VLYALCAPGEEKLYSFSVSTPEQLLDLPLGNPQELIQVTGAELIDSPAILVCAHSKRDRCCALRGRPIAAHLADILPGNVVWECSHTGGHRFAPVGIMLPTGYTYGRLSEPSALAAYLSLAGRSIPSLHGLRGRSTDTPVEQAAEVAVRLELEKKGEEVTSGGLVSRETSGREAFIALREAGIDMNVETSNEFSPEFFAAFSPKDFSEHPTLEAALTSHTFNDLLPGPGGWLVTFGLVFFAYSTILGWCYYGEKCASYLGGEKVVPIYRVIYVVTVLLGAGVNLGLVWAAADVFNGLMAVPNLIALLLLSNVIVSETRDFIQKRRSGELH